MSRILILFILGLGIKYTEGIWPPSYKVDLEDKQSFVISSDEDYNENENEMIKREDLAEIESFAEDEHKYEPLHSHVENFNKREAEKVDRLSRSIYLHPITEAPFIEEPKPFIAGFKSELNKYAFENIENPDDSLKKRSPKLDITTIKSLFKKLFSATPAMKNLGSQQQGIHDSRDNRIRIHGYNSKSIDRIFHS
ncbi:uncharacterized protein LOC117172342 isoform X2 [Belonocnema kinseyi]|uniref:uncharacterized protein LOC117172342 isoform X2 n=1 Tax=Belonocnema kinseyi TaxID=2817044 RepID=UPI00143DC360|nr:uncharacterized protein LOC117172342 isoform X2 [Belonocnema kinseyi]